VTTPSSALLDRLPQHPFGNLLTFFWGLGGVFWVASGYASVVGVGLQVFGKRGSWR